MPLVKQALIPNLLECPPFRLNVIIFVGDIGIVHVRPKAHDARKFFPHRLILPDRFAAFLDKRLHAVSFDLLLAVNADKLFDL